MLLQLDERRKNEPLAGDTAKLCLIAEMPLDRGVELELPEHAPGRLRQEPHPDIEHSRRNLVSTVEGAEHESLFRQIAFSARGNAFRYRLLPVIGLIRVGKINHLLRVEALLVFRNNAAIGEDVIHIIRTQRAGE